MALLPPFPLASVCTSFKIISISFAESRSLPLGWVKRTPRIPGLRLAASFCRLFMCRPPYFCFELKHRELLALVLLHLILNIHPFRPGISAYIGVISFAFLSRSVIVSCHYFFVSRPPSGSSAKKKDEIISKYTSFIIDTCTLMICTRYSL